MSCVQEVVFCSHVILMSEKRWKVYHLIVKMREYCVHFSVITLLRCTSTPEQIFVHTEFYYFLHPATLLIQSHANSRHLPIIFYQSKGSSWTWILRRTLQMTSVSRLLCISIETIPFFPDDVTSTLGPLVGAWASTGIVFQQASGCPVGGRGWTEVEEMWLHKSVVCSEWWWLQ